MHDYSEYEEDRGLGDNFTKTLISLADEAERAEEEVERLTNLLDIAKTNYRRVVEQEIPQIVDGLNSTLNLPDGRKITIKEQVRCSIAGERKYPALQWLNSNGHGNLIKRRFIIEFGKDQEQWADEFEQKLTNYERPLNVKREANVHPQTLQAFVRERLREGDNVPIETFGVFRQRTAKIASPA